MDDFTHACDLHEALSILLKVLEKCIEMNLSSSPEKCDFFMNAGTIVGHLIPREGIQVDPNNISIIKRVHIPQKKRDFRIFLGLVGYYRGFIKDFGKLASSLFGLLAIDSNFCWTSNSQEAFEILKQKMTTTPILTGPN